MVDSDATLHRRRSIRLKEYDYSQSGAYFVTICAHNGNSLFGQIESGQMQMNDTGRMVGEIWRELPERYSGIQLDEFVVMPNHVHGVIWIVGAGATACPIHGRARGPAPTMSLPDVIHRFKSFTANRYRHAISVLRTRICAMKLWQHNYYEHVIRNEDELALVREYITNNPAQWLLDRENPACAHLRQSASAEWQV